MNTNEIIEQAKNTVKDNILYEDYEIQYVLSNKGNITDIIFANDPKVISINPKTLKIKELQLEYSVLDEILLPELEKGKQIEYMTDDAHDYMWYIIEMYYPDDMEYTKGMVKYLEYCKNNNITRQYLDEKCDSNPSDLLELYDKLHDYFNVGDLQVVMSKDVFDTRCERFYFTFVLGYDLLNNLIKRYNHLECDDNYDFCYMIADQFIKSDYYKNTKHSAYEMLCKYVKDNKNNIRESYVSYMGIEDKTKNKDSKER